MKKILLYMTFFNVLVISSNSQVTDTSFMYGGFASLTLNQVSLSNWVTGGDNAFSTAALVNLFANYRKNKIAWDNSLDMEYGTLKTGNTSAHKNDDKIIFDSKFDYHAFSNFFYSGLLDFRTQFAKGYDYPNDSTVASRFLAPGYLLVGLGLDYNPLNYFSVNISPATARFTIVNDKALADSGKYGVNPGKKVHSEIGASLTSRFQKDIIKNVGLASNLLLFKSYTDKVHKNIIVNWEVLLNIKAGKFLTTSIHSDLIYDQSIIKKVQFKEALGIGISYKF